MGITIRSPGGTADPPAWESLSPTRTTKGKVDMRSKLAAITLTGLLLAAACGGATPATNASPAAASQGTTAARPACFPVTAPCSDEAKSLSAGGATFPAVIYTKWIDEYNKLTGAQINYQAIGSGGGIKGITDKTFDFAGSDAPLTDKQQTDAGRPLLHIPTVAGAVVPTYNIPGVTATLKFTPETLSGIFLGEITKWNDPKLVADNPDAKLPANDIVTVHRSDGSGTNYAFTEYLSKVSPTWKSKIGFGTSVEWPGGIGAKGNDGVAGAVKQNPNSIGYVELIYATQQKLGAGTLKNAAGKFVEPTLDAVTKSAEGITLPDDLRISVTNSSNADAWPISTFTFYIVPQDITDRAKALAIVRYLWWATHDGQKFAKDLSYAPLPKDVQTKTEGKLQSITSGGKPVISR